MPAGKNLLIIDGNTARTNDVTVKAGGTRTGEGYAAVVGALAPEISCTVIRPADDGADCLHQGTAFSDFNGYIWTGSALNAYDKTPEVLAQVDLAAQTFASGLPGFGSCWGLQIMTVALGGTVSLNPKGREVPFGREITPNEAGQRHPLLKGRPPHFDTVAIHMDEVSVLPPGATLLASNEMSLVQAVEIIRGSSVFWGVQYHPEFSPGDMAAILQRVREPLIAEGLCASLADVDALSADLRGLELNPADPARERLGLDDRVTDFTQRTREIQNWLETFILAG